MEDSWVELDMVILNAIKDNNTFATNCVAIGFNATVLSSKLKQAYRQEAG